MTDKNEKMRKGLKAYSHEQAILLRLIRKHKGLHQDKFDQIFGKRVGFGGKYHRVRRRGIAGDAFLLGIGINGGTEWAWWLDLLQHMMVIEPINTKRDENGKLIYFLDK